jgi:short-subunit dehydrogenase
MPTALVTGATAGIGHEFACQLAERGHALVLVARDSARLDQVATELTSRYGIAVEVLVADLSDRAQIAVVADRVADTSRPVDILVNNAGFGLRTPFLASEVADELGMLDVLCTAVLMLSHAAGRAMRERGHGQIINVSSVASFVSMGSYSAAKAWVTTFSEGLAGELAGTGVTVTALCPGYTRTEFHERARMSVAGSPDLLWLQPQELVAEALRDADRGRVLSVPGLQYKAMVGALQVLPRAVVRAAATRVAPRPPKRR